MSTLSYHVNIVSIAFFDGRGLLSISAAGGGHLVKMLITLEPHGNYLDKILHTYAF